jgi:hypothetical protein
VAAAPAEAGANSSTERTRRPLSRPLFLGLATASIGGPLALAALYIPGAAGGSSAGLATALAALVFLAPLGIWWSYSGRVASRAGLTAFVDAGAGRRAAWGHAAVWSISYFLYLPYTITFIVYDVLPVVFPGIVPYRASLELLLPVAITILVLGPARLVLVGLLALAAVQLALMVALGTVAYAHVGAAHAGAHAGARSVGNVSLLFVCASLPLYFGAEVAGGRRTIRPALVGSFLAVAALAVFAAIPIGAAPERIRDAQIPGFALAEAYAGRGFAVTVGVATAASVAALIVLEYLALGRLWVALLGTQLRPVLAFIAVPFIAADAVSLFDPSGFYSALLRPSLVALFVAQLVVFAVYPRFRRIHERLRPVDLAAAAVAAALVIYGIYTAVANTSGT